MGHQSGLGEFKESDGIYSVSRRCAWTERAEKHLQELLSWDEGMLEWQASVTDQGPKGSFCLRRVTPGWLRHLAAVGGEMTFNPALNTGRHLLELGSVPCPNVGTISDKALIGSHKKRKLRDWDGKGLDLSMESLSPDGQLPDADDPAQCLDLNPGERGARRDGRRRVPGL
ncbi:hypothetical protein E2320_016841 [Naja naja]|nr:hypothetical protein E2320_016841 [Naja naja]